MSAEVFKKFVIAMREDPKALELLKNAPKSASEEERIKVYADIAAKLGFDLSAEEIGKHLKDEELARKIRTEETARLIRELPDNDLAAVAGGKKDHDECEYTFQDKENCWFTDGCDWYFIGYDNYICHYTYYDECHIPSAGFVIAD